jgi:hypothetical protein
MLIVVPTPSIEFIDVAEATGNCIQRHRFKKKLLIYPLCGFDSLACGTKHQC